MATFVVVNEGCRKCLYFNGGCAHPLRNVEAEVKSQNCSYIRLRYLPKWVIIAIGLAMSVSLIADISSDTRKNSISMFVDHVYAMNKRAPNQSSIDLR